MCSGKYSGHRLRRLVAGFFATDLLRKLIALAIALALYWIVAFNLTGKERVFNSVKLDVELPEDLVYVGGEAPRLKNVRLSGGESVLNAVRSDDLSVRVRVRPENYRSGEAYVASILPGDVRGVPFGVSVEGVEPGRISLNLERKISRKLPVEPVFAGREDMDVDYAVTKVAVNPAEVTVTGTESLMRDLEELPTEPIPLSRSVTESFDYRVKLAARPGLAISPTAVEAYVEVVKENESRAIDGVPILLLMPPALENGCRVELISASGVTVTLHGPKGKLAIFPEKSLKVFADLTQLSGAGTYTVDVYCQPPAGGEITVKNVYPRQVQLKITEKINK